MGVARALRVAAGTAQQPETTIGLPNGVSALTFTCRYRVDDVTASVTLCYLETSGGAEKLTLGNLDTGYTSWFRDEAYAGPRVSTQDPTNNVWHWAAVRFNDADSPKAKVWFAPDGGSIYTGTGDPGAISGQVTVLSLSNYHATRTHDLTEIKIWLSALTDGEVEAERSYVVPQKDGAWAWYGMDSDTLSTCFTDDSGNGHTLTATANPTVITGAGTTWDVGGSASPGSITTTITL